MKDHVNQGELIQRLRDEEEMTATPARVHAWIRSGMPTVPGGKKPRFHFPSVKAWLAGAQQVDPLEMDVRDRLFRRGLGKTG
jgi:hypothetical protein